MVVLDYELNSKTQHFDKMSLNTAHCLSTNRDYTIEDFFLHFFIAIFGRVLPQSLELQAVRIT